MPHSWDSCHRADDFLADEAFRTWVRSGRFRDPSDPGSRWLVAHPERQVAARQALLFLGASGLDEPVVSDEEVEAIRRGAWQRVETARESGPVVRPLPVRRWLGWAAAALVLLTLGWWGYRELGYTWPGAETAQQEPPVQWLDVRNASRRPALVSLPDGSTVWLETDGLLRHPTRFVGTNRDVELSGEAFFEVTKDADHPFRVRTQTLLTTVLGTSFTVRAKTDDSEARVQVRTGRVAVYAIGAARVSTKPVVVLEARQQAVIRTKTAVVVRSGVTQPLALATRLDRQSFEFTDAPVATIFRAIERAYGLRIEYPAGAYQSCSITTSLSDEPLPEKLRIVTATMGTDVQFALEKDRIRVWGSGCQ